MPTSSQVSALSTGPIGPEEKVEESAPAFQFSRRPDAVGSQARLDDLTGQWVVFAPDRENRPNDFAAQDETAVPTADCPFCSGNESQTPPHVYSAGGSASEPWGVRVVPNKFPAVSLANTTQRVPLTADGSSATVPSSDAPSSGSVFRGSAGSGSAVSVSGPSGQTGMTGWEVQSSMTAAGSPELPAQATRDSAKRRQHRAGDSLVASRNVSGGHEVIIESSKHVESMSQLDADAVVEVFRAFKVRLLAWRELRSIQYVSVFKNVGRQAGASLHHSHSQLIALDQIPADVKRNMWLRRNHHAKMGCCLLCDLNRHEVKARQRIIAKTDNLLAYCPFASAFAYQVRITSQMHLGRYEDLSDDQIAEVARLTQRVTTWLERMRPGVAYNLVLHTQPPGDDGKADAFHWSLDLVPRTSHFAGFEIGCGTMINSVLPEQAAAEYRQQASQERLRVM
ncbi:MAG: DUF4921 family protein [Planctomycetota bacterium]